MTEVTTGLMSDLAKMATAKIGRKVTVYRIIQNTTTKYSLGVEGCFPSLFLNLTTMEVKARLLMICDMVSSSVIGPAVQEPVSVQLDQQSSDIALAIAEHAFEAGYTKGWQDRAAGKGSFRDGSWSEYTPPEELCGFSFTVKPESDTDHTPRPGTIHNGDPVRFDAERGWGFWDETWSEWHGGFKDEQEARSGLDAYVETL